MRLMPVLYPFKKKKSIKAFFLSAFIISLVYLLFSISLSLIATKPFPEGRLMDIIVFGGFKAFSTFIMIDWIILALFPIAGGLLFANYSYYKCNRTAAGNTGLFVGLIAATCPACILPILGVTAFLTFLTKISIYIKITALIVLIGSTLYIANKNYKCSINKL